MEKFTKGPWSVKSEIHDGVKYVIEVASDSQNALVCQCFGTTTPLVDWYASVCSVDANAALIAAAPEMYEMLKDLAANYINSDCKISDIENLLAKARGE